MSFHLYSRKNLLQDFRQFLHPLFLGIGSCIFRSALFVQSAFVADAYTIVVKSFGMTSLRLCTGGRNHRAGCEQWKAQDCIVPVVCRMLALMVNFREKQIFFSVLKNAQSVKTKLTLKAQRAGDQAPACWEQRLSVLSVKAQHIVLRSNNKYLTDRMFWNQKI